VSAQQDVLQHGGIGEAAGHRQRIGTEVANGIPIGAIKPFDSELTEGASPEWVIAGFESCEGGFEELVSCGVGLGTGADHPARVRERHLSHAPGVAEPAGGGTGVEEIAVRGRGVTGAAATLGEDDEQVAPYGQALRAELGIVEQPQPSFGECGGVLMGETVEGLGACAARVLGGPGRALPAKAEMVGGEAEVAAGREAPARRYFETAAGWLDSSTRWSRWAGSARSTRRP